MTTCPLVIISQCTTPRNPNPPRHARPQYRAPPWVSSREPRKGERERSTGSAASPTTSSATLCPFSPPKTAPARRSSPPGGATYGAPLLSTSTSTTTTLLAAASVLARSPTSSLRTLAPAAASSCYPYYDYPDKTALDGWLHSPALDNLQELRFQHYPRLLLPPSVRRFSSTLRIARFCECTFPDGNNGGAPLLLPVLESLTLFDVRISGSTLHALLAGCPVLQSLFLFDNYGFPRLQIVSPSLRSILLGSYWRSLMSHHELVIEDAPCLETIQCSEKLQMNISVISAPRLAILGTLFDDTPRLQFGATVLQVWAPSPAFMRDPIKSHHLIMMC
jgi:hypothetical protein